MLYKDYMNWIMEQEDPAYTLAMSDENHIHIDHELAEGFVNIYHLDSDIVELRLNRKGDGEDIFFLHFELTDEDHAHELFREMIQTLLKQKEKRTLHVLLSCTSGLTTSFFAEKLNEAAATLSLDYEFAAVPYTKLYEKGFTQDVLLIAPQLAYKYNKIKEVFSKQLVLQIPGTVFATYNAGDMITMLVREIEKAKLTKEKKAVAKVMREIENNACIFVISMTHDTDETRYAYRLYDKGDIIFTEEVVKQKNSLQDILDILDTEFVSFRKNYDINAISISMPGILNENDRQKRIEYAEIASKISARYSVPAFVQHNALAVAFGYYAGQNRYNIVSYQSQPRGSMLGGQGTVYRGMPISGINHMAGEIAPLFMHEYAESHEHPDHESPENIRRSVISYLLANIAVIDPEVILIRCEAAADIDELREELKKYIIHQELPELVYVSDIREYACLGAMLYALHELKEQAKKH